MHAKPRSPRREKTFFLRRYTQIYADEVRARSNAWQSARLRTPQPLTGAKFFTPARYSIKCEKPGFGAAERTLSAGMNGWYVGNIVFGGLIGLLIVDPATGAMWDIKEHNMVLNLSPLATEPEKPQIVPDNSVSSKEEEKAQS